MVEPSRSVLQMTLSSTHGMAKVLPKFRCSVLPACSVDFFDTQITGAVFMMQRPNVELDLPATGDSNRALVQDTQTQA